VESAGREATKTGYFSQTILLAIPASSAASERVFSAAGCTVTARRTALDSETVDNILFVHSIK